ncbi:hypothetical protein DAEQUDRAFT_722712 [Daedalea quercina L-15889]|uniref:Uncharacterized protein n=1 Tax=Daedalea quercina L-15889 TaxID=1314783 RepID=A0A165SVL0_9APHY|nr:hypothetical protein DAEQUDRAFT_722712 [Daedalea quercina L-15889]
MVELRVLRDELVAAASAIGRISQDLSVGLVDVEEGKTSLKAKLAELEAERSSTLLRLQVLETQNVELRELLERNQPDLVRAIRARDAALRKLHLMREVVRDLIEERRAGAEKTVVHKGRPRTPGNADDHESSESPSGESWSNFGLTEAESSLGEDNDGGPEEDAGSIKMDSTSPTVLEQESRASTKSSISIKRASDAPNTLERNDSSTKHDTRTVETSKTREPDSSRGAVSASVRNSPVDAEPANRIAHCDNSRTSKSNSKTGRVVKTKPVVQTVPKGDTDNPFKKLAETARHTLQASPAEADWYLEYQKSPATAARPLGPLSYGFLGERLSLDDDTMLRIESVESCEEPSMQLHIYRDMAFVCHPVILEGPATTYLVSWSSAIVNVNVKKYLTQGPDRPADAIFHLFVKSMKRDGWFYLGGHKLLAADMPSIWHTRLSKQDKRELVAGLQERWSWQNAPDAEQIAGLIEAREVGQCSIELQSGSSLQERSMEFARRFLLRK